MAGFEEAAFHGPGDRRFSSRRKTREPDHRGAMTLTRFARGTVDIACSEAQRPKRRPGLVAIGQIPGTGCPAISFPRYCGVRPGIDEDKTPGGWLR